MGSLKGMSRLSERLDDLAASLDGDEWNHPLTCVDDCKEAADYIRHAIGYRIEVLSKLSKAERRSCERGAEINRLHRLMGRKRRKISMLHNELSDVIRVLMGLLKRLQPKDSCGVAGSEFYTCLACGAGGSPHKAYEHKECCPVLWAETALGVHDDEVMCHGEPTGLSEPDSGMVGE